MTAESDGCGSLTLPLNACDVCLRKSARIEIKLSRHEAGKDRHFDRSLDVLCVDKSDLWTLIAECMIVMMKLCHVQKEFDISG